MGIPGNTVKNAFRISKYVLTKYKHAYTEKLEWEYIPGKPGKMPLVHQNIYLLIKNMSKL